MVDINDLITGWTTIIFDFVRSLGTYQIVTGVSFLGVIIAIGTFSIIVKFFFSRITGGN